MHKNGKEHIHTATVQTYVVVVMVTIIGITPNDKYPFMTITTMTTTASYNRRHEYHMITSTEVLL